MTETYEDIFKEVIEDARQETVEVADDYSRYPFMMTARISDTPLATARRYIDVIFQATCSDYLIDEPMPEKEWLDKNEWLTVTVDSDNRIIHGIRKDGTMYFNEPDSLYLKIYFDALFHDAKHTRLVQILHNCFEFVDIMIDDNKNIIK